MGAADIQAKIKRGLAKAIARTSSPSSELVYLIKKTVTGGSSPVTPGVTTTKDVLLVNAIFKNYDQSLISGNIQAGDRQLICDNEVQISVGDIIKQGSINYIVIDLGQSAPTSDALVYLPQLRAQ